MPWMTLAPMLVTLVANRRGGLVWLGVAVGWYALMLAVAGRGIVPPSSVPDWYAPYFTMICPAGLVLALFGIVWSYEVARDEALAAVRAASEEAAAARDAAEGAHREARVVLDQVDQGLVVVRRDGTLASARSSALDRWLGAPTGEVPVWELFAAKAPDFATWLEVGWGELEDAFLPTEVILDQLPRRFAFEGRHFSIAYRPLGEEAEEGIMVVVTDETEVVEAQRAEQAQREQLGVLSRMLSAPQTVLDFVHEARALVGQVAAGAAPHLERRWIHTLKGNGAVFGLQRFASELHAVEDDLAPGEGATPAQRERVAAAWADVEAMLEPVLAGAASDALTVERDAFEAAIRDLEGGTPPRAVAAAMRRWRSSHPASARRSERTSSCFSR